MYHLRFLFARLTVIWNLLVTDCLITRRLGVDFVTIYTILNKVPNGQAERGFRSVGLKTDGILSVN